MSFNISKNVLSAVFAPSSPARGRSKALVTVILILLVFAGSAQGAGDAEFAAQAKQVNDTLGQLRQHARGEPEAMRYINQAERLWKQVQSQWAMQQRHQQQSAALRQTQTKLLAQQKELMTQLIKLQQQVASSKRPELKTIDPFGDYRAHGVSLHPKDGKLQGPGTIADTPELSGLFRQPDANAKESPGMDAWKEAMRELASISNMSSSIATQAATSSQTSKDEGMWDIPLSETSPLAFEKPDPATPVDLTDTSDSATIETLRTAAEDQIATDLTKLVPDTTEGSDFLYTLQIRTLAPKGDRGHPLDTPESPPVGFHGFVQGTGSAFGYLKDPKGCDTDCINAIDRSLHRELQLSCKSRSDSESDLQKCLSAGLPFTPDNYDMVVGVAVSHKFYEDLLFRVRHDQRTSGEYSRQNALNFGTLKDRDFDILDCHSNGAMLCLAALRHGGTTAKKVRLFGPQINEQAAQLWREWADQTLSEIEIYINNGDPVPAVSWVLNPDGRAGSYARALMHTWNDSNSGAIDKILRETYGFKVKRFTSQKPFSKLECDYRASFDLNCHSFLVYEENVGANH